MTSSWLLLYHPKTNDKILSKLARMDTMDNHENIRNLWQTVSSRQYAVRTSCWLLVLLVDTHEYNEWEVLTCFKTPTGDSSYCHQLICMIKAAHRGFLCFITAFDTTPPPPPPHTHTHTHTHTPRPFEFFTSFLLILYTVNAVNPYIANRIAVRIIFSKNVCSKSSLSLISVNTLAMVPSNL